MFMQMTVVIEGVTFEKVIGESNIYAEQYGVQIPESSYANTFPELIAVATKWLKTQD